MAAPDDKPSTALRSTRPADPDIPPSRASRENLRAVCRDYASTHDLVPPLPIEELAVHCRGILNEAGLGDPFQQYTAVLLNNELWRDALAAVPCDRRMLLLPKCLRDEAVCRADIDGVGLICRRCGGCMICDFQEEAEKLGYVTLVAEGSPVVMSLIQSGRIQAVVGVSCLETLRGVYPFMEAAAIPGIALPLLQSGCVNTSVDTDWLWEALYLSDDAGARPVNLEALRREVDAWFTPPSLDALLGPAHGPAEQVARQWLLTGGKRWRPFLTACAAAAIVDSPSSPANETLRKLAVAVECFHKASLVHDDIEDADTTRYGRDTLHVRHGVPIAVNVGDFLLGEGYRLIAECRAAPQAIVEMLAAAARGHRDLCVGQGRELDWAREPRPLAVSDIVDIYRMKTAPAFGVALSLGVLQAGADGHVLNALSAYTDALGVAYQIRDDLADGADHVPPRPSILSAVTDDRAADMLEHYKHQAVTALREIDIANLKGVLRRVLAAIFNDTERMGCCRDRQG